MSDETLNQNNHEILKAIADLAGSFETKFQSLENKFDALEARFDKSEARFDKFEKAANAQFEAIREGIIYNNVRFERLTAEVYEARADISKIKATLTELTEEVRNSRKTLV